ncbi:MAG: peptide deformylase [Flavobacteriales bacterium]|nr:peptide deformylase [Flavobacteriales bacterium]
MPSVQAFSNAIYKTEAWKVADRSAAKDLVSQLLGLQQSIKHPMVSAKHLGIDVQVISIDLNYLKSEKVKFSGVFINPKILREKAPLVSQLEDDPSIPGLSVSIERPKQIEVSFLNEELNEQKVSFSDLAARWIMHGVDQLNGVSIVDKLNKHRQRSIKAHLKRISERKIETNYKLEYDS